MKNYFQKILALFTGNDYPGSTRQEFYKWLVDEEHVSEKDEALQTLWEEGYKSGTAPNLHQSYELLRRNAGIPSVREERRIRPIHIWQIAAAVFFIVAASSIYLSTIGKKVEPNLLQQYIPTAEVHTLTLPDGTKVQLNSQSTLLYPQEFTGKDRSVFLIGEANFKVKPNKKHPFIVKSNDFQVTEINELGSHHMFLAKVTAVHVDDAYIDEKGTFHLNDTGLLAYSHGTYHELAKAMGNFGYSVRKTHRKKQKRKKR